MSLETTEHMIRAARCAGTLPVVRTQEAAILRVLDAGASGVQVPMVNTAQQAKRIVDACKFPPLGTRSSAGTARAGGYTFHAGPAQIERANAGVAIIPMIESAEAVGNLDAILAVRGVDALFVGLSDLALSMGYPGDSSHPRVQETLASIFGRAAAAGSSSAPPPPMKICRRAAAAAAADKIIGAPPTNSSFFSFFRNNFSFYNCYSPIFYFNLPG